MTAAEDALEAVLHLAVPTLQVMEGVLDHTDCMISGRSPEEKEE